MKTLSIFLLVLLLFPKAYGEECETKFTTKIKNSVGKTVELSLQACKNMGPVDKAVTSVFFVTDKLKNLKDQTLQKFRLSPSKTTVLLTEEDQEPASSKKFLSIAGIKRWWEQVRRPSLTSTKEGKIEGFKLLAITQGVSFSLYVIRTIDALHGGNTTQAFEMTMFQAASVFMATTLAFNYPTYNNISSYGKNIATKIASSFFIPFTLTSIWTALDLLSQGDNYMSVAKSFLGPAFNSWMVIASYFFFLNALQEKGYIDDVTMTKIKSQQSIVENVLYFMIILGQNNTSVWYTSGNTGLKILAALGLAGYGITLRLPENVNGQLKFKEVVFEKIKEIDFLKRFHKQDQCLGLFAF